MPEGVHMCLAAAQCWRLMWTRLGGAPGLAVPPRVRSLLAGCGCVRSPLVFLRGNDGVDVGGGSNDNNGVMHPEFAVLGAPVLVGVLD